MNKSLFSMSDLVELEILSKPITEFTNADIGTEVSIPYTDVGVNFMLKSSLY